MRRAIISDIHGNLEALEAVLQRAERERVEEIVCLGDIVGYGPNPNECLALVRSKCSLSILGNHDEWVLHTPDHSRVPESVWQSIRWTSQEVSPEHKEWIAGLPLIVHRDREIFVHASPLYPDRWEYITDEASCLRYFPVIGSSCCYVGHSHVAGRYVSPAAGAHGGRAGVIVNVGSVGQPRDGDPSACFVVASDGVDDAIRHEFHRVAYDPGPVSARILSAGLPEFFAYRLTVGR